MRQRERNGRYAKEHACHACGKPAPVEDYWTDDQVCGGDHAPGFILCARKRCIKKRTALSIEERRTLYTETVQRLRDAGTFVDGV